MSQYYGWNIELKKWNVVNWKTVVYKCGFYKRMSSIGGITYLINDLSDEFLTHGYCNSVAAMRDGYYWKRRYLK